jgi:nickel/cobalt exporter
MSVTLAGALATAGLLGVTHAVEPDHVAGISAVTSDYGDSRLSALVGACFSLGHVALVVAWLVGGYLLLGRTSFPAALDAVGTAGVAVLLGVLGGAMVVGGLRSILHTHDHGGAAHAHPHVHLPLVGAVGHAHDESGPDADDGRAPGDSGRDTDAREHTVGAYLRTGLVGALFTLSPPVSMIVFATTLFPDYGTGVVALAVVTYAVAITATMSLLGAGAGVLFGLVGQRGANVHAAARVVAGVAIAAFAGLLLVDAGGVVL